MPRPKKSRAEESLDKAEENFQEFESSLKCHTMDSASQVPMEETEPQTKITAKEVKRAPEVRLSPKRVIFPSAHPKTGEMEKFNEKWRKEYEFDKEYVHFIAENNEVQGERIEIWTRPYPGVPAEWWEVPVNKPVWGPRYLADQIRRKCYTRFVMEDKPTSAEAGMTYYGSMVAETRTHRLNANKAPDQTSVSFHKKASAF